MKAKELRSMEKKELNDKMDELIMELIKNNSTIATGTTPKSPGMVKDIKKNIARIKTVLSEVDKKKVEEKEKNKEAKN